MSERFRSPSAGTPAVDSALDALSHRRRRRLLAVLRDDDHWMAVADVVKALALDEGAATIEDVPDEEIAWIYASLFHTHLPKLEDDGAVERNRERNTVALTPRGERLRSSVECIREELGGAGR